MKHARLLLPIALLITLSLASFFVQATCNPADVGTSGNDAITCDLANQPATNVEGLAGDDTIFVDNGVTASNVSGGNNGAVAESGDDLIVNNGVVSGTINGDSKFAAGNGDDVIVNNGTAQDLIGEGGGSPGSGNDTIINNGTVVGIS